MVKLTKKQMICLLEWGEKYGITKDKNKIYKLARKDVVREKILLIKKRIEVLDDAVKRLDSIENDSNIHKLIERYNMLDEKRISFSKQELEIYNNRFSKNPFNKDRLIYKTQGNVAMRSKSERFIGTLAMELFYCFRHFSRKGKQKLPKNTAKYIAIGSVCLRNKCKMPISYIFIQLLGNYLLKQLSKQQV